MITSKCKIPLTDKLLFFKNYIDKQIEIGISNKNKLTGIFCTYDPLSGRCVSKNKILFRVHIFTFYHTNFFNFVNINNLFIRLGDIHFNNLCGIRFINIKII